MGGVIGKVLFSILCYLGIGAYLFGMWNVWNALLLSNTAGSVIAYTLLFIVMFIIGLFIVPILVYLSVVIWD